MVEDIGVTVWWMAGSAALIYDSGPARVSRCYRSPDIIVPSVIEKNQTPKFRVSLGRGIVGIDGIGGTGLESYSLSRPSRRITERSTIRVIKRKFEN